MLRRFIRRAVVARFLQTGVRIIDDQRTARWYPMAAYLYVLHLDGPSLAWEYLRRNPDYRRDWLRRRRRLDAAHRWGLRLMENPTRDARDAHPLWCPDPESVLRLYRDDDSPPDAMRFEFWRIPGHKQLLHDGKHLTLISRWPAHCVRFTLTQGIEDGVPFAYALRACATPSARYRVLLAVVNQLAEAGASTPAAFVRARPTPTALLELHTLQALDAALSGASLRQIACGMFGAAAVARDWYADGSLRSRVRRLVRRGQSLMRGGYLRLLAQAGRFAQPH
jgi:hypothetical protein